MGIDFTDNLIRLFSIILITAFFILNYFVIYNDLRSHLIPNSILILAMKYIAVLFAAMLVTALLTRSHDLMKYLSLALINSLISLLAGYALYYFDLWSAGDGKLFPVIALLVPLAVYQNQYVPYFPSIIILVNSYIIALVYYFFSSLWSSIKRSVLIVRCGKTRETLTARAKGIVKYWETPAAIRSTIGTILCFTSIVFIARIMQARIQAAFSLPPQSLVIITFILMFLIVGNIMKLMRRSTVFLVAVSVFYVMTLAYQILYRHNNPARMLLDLAFASAFMMIFMPLARNMIDLYADRVTVASLAANTFLRGESAKVLSEEHRIKDIAPGIALTHGQVAEIKQKCPPDMLLQRFIYLPFSIFIFFGSLFTIFTGRSIMHYFM